uniref:Putative homing endonuclease n=1 Tax=viral metagenome TaxID=1070528 RepID=A0A6M3LMI4_9ZZZZ
MATRRMIASSIWEDDWFGQLGFFEQALWVGLFSKCADDQGRLLDNAVLLRAAVFPYKDMNPADIDGALVGFEEAGRIHRYETDGKRLIQVLNWWEHQPQQWASPSKWAAPEGWVDHVRTRENNHGVGRPMSRVAAWRSAVFERDGFRCQRCGTSGVKLNAHHITPWCLDSKKRFAANNGMTLCVGCHRTMHKPGWLMRARRIG